MHGNIRYQSINQSINVQRRFWWRFEPSGPGEPATLKAEERILENKRCSAGCKLTRAVPGTSAVQPKSVVTYILYFCIFH